MDYSNFKFNGMRLNNALRAVRRERNMSQQKVADFLGVDRSTYSYYESGKSELDVKTALALCEIFNVTLNELLNRDSVVAKTNLVTDVNAAYQSLKNTVGEHTVPLSQYQRKLLKLTDQMDDRQRSDVMIYAMDVLNQTGD